MTEYRDVDEDGDGHGMDRTVNGEQQCQSEVLLYFFGHRLNCTTHR